MTIAITSFFETKEFDNREMQWQKWGDEVLAITFELPDIKSISVEGKGIQSKIEELGLYPNNYNRITKIRTYNAKFNREIIIENNGKVKMALWPTRTRIQEIMEGSSFYEQGKKLIGFYEYVEKILGEGI